MSQMPDKLWIHKDTKYNTGDGVYAYQYEFAQDIEDEGIENFVEYTPTDAFINKACEWLSNHVNDYIINDKYILPNGKMSRDWLKVKSEMFDDFRKYMKEE